MSLERRTRRKGLALAVLFACAAAGAALAQMPASELTVGTPDGQQVTVPRSEQAAALAQETLRAVGAARPAPRADVAVQFSVSRDNAAAGSLKCSFSPEGGAKAEFAGPPGFPEADWIQQLAALGLNAAWRPPAAMPQTFAVRAGERVVMVDYGAMNEQVVAKMIFVEGGLNVTREVTIFANGQVREQIVTAETVGEGRRVRQVQFIAQVPDEPKREITFTFAYAPGVPSPVPVRVDIVDAGGGAQTRWSLAQAGAPAAQAVSVPHTPEAEALARKVLEGARSAAYTLVDAPVQGFRATYDVSRDNEKVGRLVIEWRRAAPEIARTFEGEADRRTQTWLGNSVRFALMSSILSSVSAKPDHAVYAAETADGYALDASATPGLAYRMTNYARDFRRTRDVQRYDDGLELITTYVVQTAEGRHYVQEIERVARMPGAPELRNRFAFQYVAAQGHVGIHRLVIRDIKAPADTVWSLQLQENGFQVLAE